MLFIFKIYKVIFLTKSDRWPPLQSCKRFWQQLSYTLLRRPSLINSSVFVYIGWLEFMNGHGTPLEEKQSEQTKTSTNASALKVKLQIITEPNSLIKSVFIISKFGLSAAVSRQFFFSISESVAKCGGFEMYSQCVHISFVS